MTAPAFAGVDLREEHKDMWVISVGDRITFRAVTAWSGKAATRKVTGFVQGTPTVRFGGCNGFQVDWSEIIRVERGA